MKKIVALVLSLVMVLGLATTAFAVADKYDMYKADDTMATQMKLDKPEHSDQVLTEVAAATNKDGSGNVAYIKIGGEYFVKTTAPTVKSFAITEAGKTDVLFYVNLTTATDAKCFEYLMPVSAWDKWGMTCGNVNNVAFSAADRAEDYFYNPLTKQVHMAGDAAASGANFLLDGVVVSAGTAYDVIDHKFVANNFKYDNVTLANVPTAAVCTTCLETATSIYKIGKAPAQSTVYDLYVDGVKSTVWCVVPGVAAADAPAVEADKVESADTFDAGIAMYVGMSVMAAAGSAVVLKKKD